MYDAGRCDKSKGASGMCGGWNCSSSGACGDFKDGKMQLYDVGMASMHTMDSLALAQLARAIGRTTEAATLQQRAEKMTALIEANLWDEASGIYVNKVVSAAKNCLLVHRQLEALTKRRCAAGWSLESPHRTDILLRHADEWKHGRAGGAHDDRLADEPGALCRRAQWRPCGEQQRELARAVRR